MRKGKNWARMLLTMAGVFTVFSALPTVFGAGQGSGTAALLMGGAESCRRWLRSRDRADAPQGIQRILPEPAARSSRALSGSPDSVFQPLRCNVNRVT